MKTAKEKYKDLPPELKHLEAQISDTGSESNDSTTPSIVPNEDQDEKTLPYPWSFIAEKKDLAPDIQAKIGAPVYVLSFEKMVEFACFNPIDEKIDLDKKDRLVQISQSSEAFDAWLHSEIFPNITQYFTLEDPSDTDYMQYIMRVFKSAKDQERLRQITVLFFAGFDYFKADYLKKNQKPFLITLAYDDKFKVRYDSTVDIYDCKLCLKTLDRKYPQDVRPAYLTFPQFLNPPFFVEYGTRMAWHEIGHIFHIFFSISQRQKTLSRFLLNEFLTELTFPDLASDQREQTDQAITEFIQNGDPVKMVQFFKIGIENLSKAIDQMCVREQELLNSLKQKVLEQLNQQKDQAFASSEFIKTCVELLKDSIYLCTMWSSPDEISQIIGLIRLENGIIIINPFCDACLWKEIRWTHLYKKSMSYLNPFSFVNPFPTEENIRIWLHLLGLDYDSYVTTNLSE